MKFCLKPYCSASNKLPTWWIC